MRQLVCRATGFSIEYHLQYLLAGFSPSLSLSLHVLLFPLLAFYFALKIIRYFLNGAWSTMIALLFFSNVVGFPFHVFALEIVLGDINGYNVPTVKTTDISTVVSLAALSSADPRNLYQRKIFNIDLVAAVVFLILLMHPQSVLSVVMLGLKFYSQLRGDMFWPLI